jgi:iron complex outermembrane receptor protein
VDQDYTGELVSDARPTATSSRGLQQRFSGNATLAYQATDNTNVFVRWSTGYRSGGFNGEIYNNPVEEETIEQWEFGVKSDVVPGTLRVNASIFQYTYDDMQVSQIAGQPRGAGDLVHRQRRQVRPLGYRARGCSGRRPTPCW